MEGDAVTEQPEEEPRGPRDQRPRAPRRRALWIAAAAVAVAIGALVWLNWPAQDVESVTVGGAEFATNMQMEEQGGYVYAYIPVNTDVGDVVIEVADAEDNREIREFLDSLDTLVPGEHVLALSDSNLHIIVDGMSEG